MKIRRIIQFIGAAVGILLLGNVLAQDQQSPDNPPLQEPPDSRPDSVLLPGDQFDPTALPGDQFEPASLPGDQFDPAALPGDQFDPAALPGDQFDPAALPGDQFDPAALPGDQFDRPALPGDQFDSATVPADPLFHFLYDGTTLRNRGSAAVTPELVVKPGSTAPRSEDSPFGPAVYFSGMAAYAIPYEFDLVRYPAVTITAWVRQDSDTNDTRAIFSRDSDGVSLSVDGGRLAMRSGRKGVQFNQRLPKDEWVFVAGVTDTAAGWLRMHQNDAEPYYLNNINTATKPQRLLAHPVNVDAEKRPYVFVGAANFFNWSKAARAIAMQDIRVFTRALSENEIDAIRRRTDPSATASAAQTTHAIGETEKNDQPASPVSDIETDTGGSGTQRPPAQMPPSGTVTRPRNAPELEPAIERSVDQVPDDIENPEIGLPTDAPKPKYDSPEAAEEAARQRAETAEELRDQQQAINIGDPHPVGGPTYTVVAGFTGEIQQALDFETKFLHEISWMQRNTIPCAIGITSEQDVGGPRGLGAKVLELGCDSRTLGNKASRSVRIYPSVVTAIQACNASNTRLKGIRIAGAEANADGTLHYGPASDEESYANCGEFTSPMICPNHWAATGIIVHSADRSGGGDGEKIVGLQLICREAGLQ